MLNCACIPKQAKSQPQAKASCEIVKESTANDLTINDIVVKNPESTVACLRAIFLLNIKVQEIYLKPPRPDSTSPSSNASQDLNEEDGFILGFVPLDTILRVENNCPNKSSADENKELDELDMIVTFECGLLALRFKQSDNGVYVDGIKGQINLGE